MAEVQEQKIKELEKKVGKGGKSPLFAQLASFYLQHGKANEALRLCDEGLATFAHYTTGHLIKGKALLALKMNAEARREFEIVAEFLPANETVAFILSNIQPSASDTLAPSPEETSGVESPSLDTTPPEGPVAEVVQPSEPEVVFPIQETPEATQPTNIFEAVGQTPEPTEDPFGFGGGGGDQQTPVAETDAVETTSNPFEGFPSQPESEGTSPTTESASGSIFDFPFQAQEAPAVGPEEESFEAFADRLRGELGGGENTTTLEEYLNAAPAERETASSPTETIENLAEKLQSAKRITPVIDLSTKATIPSSETDTPASTGFVTPTLAEIYAKQGWYDDAIKAYRTLCVNKPAEKDRFEKRIAELEELKNQQGSS